MLTDDDKEWMRSQNKLLLVEVTNIVDKVKSYLQDELAPIKDDVAAMMRILAPYGDK